MTAPIHGVGQGRLIRYTTRLPGLDDHWLGMVGLASPITGRRRPLIRVPVGQTGALVAVTDAGADLEPGQDYVTARAAGKVGVLLAAGIVVANTPVPGQAGPADLVGCAPEPGEGFPQLHPIAETVADRTVGLEIHRVGCGCCPTAPGHDPRPMRSKEAT